MGSAAQWGHGHGLSIHPFFLCFGQTGETTRCLSSLWYADTVWSLPCERPKPQCCGRCRLAGWERMHWFFGWHLWLCLSVRWHTVSFHAGAEGEYLAEVAKRRWGLGANCTRRWSGLFDGLEQAHL